jgi:hypothetical protein
MPQQAGAGDLMAARRIAPVLIVTGALVSGCSETLPLINLPDVAKLPEKVLSKDEQQKTMNQMIEKSHSHQAEAAKQIEKAK